MGRDIKDSLEGASSTSKEAETDPSHSPSEETGMDLSFASSPYVTKLPGATSTPKEAETDPSHSPSEETGMDLSSGSSPYVTEFLGFSSPIKKTGMDPPPCLSEETEIGPPKRHITGSAWFIDELKKRKYKSGDEVVLIMDPEDLTCEYLMKNGFHSPIIIQSDSMEKLGMKLPLFTDWSDLEAQIGGETSVEIIDVEKQEPFYMSFSKYVKYMNSTERTKSYNLLSLECSKTSLDELILPPRITQQLDWIKLFWPYGDNKIRPTVEKYCLISPKNAYTDFHIDFGGSSVWYHIVKGQKTFFLIRPSDTNFSLYTNWLKSSKTSDMFFSDKVEECFQYTVSAGTTLFLPTGWIHAVLTNEDSLVYGGNFLHSLNMELQLTIYTLEKSWNTPKNYLFPLFEDLHWIVAHELLKELEVSNKKKSVVPNYLIKGLKSLLFHLKQWLQNPSSASLPRLYYENDNVANDFLKEMNRQIKLAERIIHEANPPKPVRELTRIRKKTVHKDFIDFKLLDLRSPNRMKELPKKRRLDNEASQAGSSGLKLLIRKGVVYPLTSANMNVDFDVQPVFNQASSSTLFDYYGQPTLNQASSSIMTDDVHEDSCEIESEEFINKENTIENSSYDVESSASTSTLKNSPKEAMGKFPHSFSSFEERLKKKYNNIVQQNSGLPGCSSSSLDYGDMTSVSSKPLHLIRTKTREDPGFGSSLVHQDEDYVYPSLELSEDEDDPHVTAETKDDEAWSPKGKIGVVAPRTDRPSRIRKQNIAVGKGLEAASSNSILPKIPKISKKKKAVKHIKEPSAPQIPSTSKSNMPTKKEYPAKTESSEKMAPQVTHITPNTSPSKSPTKAKKGLATPKQRLGKILKLNKMTH